jgi:broad specificity phosphatase PhoE
MKYKVLAIIFFLIINIFPSASMAQNDLDERAIYVIRHAEKKADKDNPALSEEGEERAERLKKILQDKDIKAVYSSDTRRTRHTIIPFADDKGLHLNLYDTDNHGELVAKLQDEKENVVVIGHSNTVHHIINLLVGRKIMEELEESDYENIFIVYIDEEGGTRLERKQYSEFE